MSIDKPPTTAFERPRLLLVLLGLAGFLSIFDQVITVSSIPFMRNPAALTTALALGLYVWYRRNGLLLHHGSQRWMIAFLLYTAVVESARGIWTGDPEFLRYMQWVQVLVLASVTVDLARDRRAFTLVWGGIVAAVLFMAVATTVGLPLFTLVHEGRVGFAGVNLNTQGYWSAMVATSVVWWLLARWPRFGWQGTAAIAAFGTLLLALVQTASRSALVALVVGLVIVLVLSLRARNLSAYATIVPIAILLAAFFLADATILRERFSDALAGQDLGTRDILIVRGIELLSRQPWFGYGPAFLEVLGEARNRPRAISSHNSYLQIALTFGIPALVLWAGIVASALVRAWRSWSRGGEPLGALMLALVAASLTFGLVGDLGFNKFFWIMIALAAQTPMGTASPTMVARRGRVPSARVVPGSPTGASSVTGDDIPR